MKDYKVYVCEKCGKEFPDDREKCEEHEGGHIRPEYYTLWDAGSYQPEDKYPTYITIPMTDGAEVLYEKAAINKEADQIESSPAIGSSQESPKEEPFTF